MVISRRLIEDRSAQVLTLGAAVFVAAAGAAVALIGPEIALAVAAAALVAIGSFLSPASGLRLLLVASMLGGLSAETPFGNLRMDQAAVLPVLIGVIVRRGADRKVGIDGLSNVLLICFVSAYLGLNLATSLFLAPLPLVSLRVVLWLGLSALAMLVILVVVPAYMDARRALIELAIIGGAAALFAVVTYFLATAGVSTFGVQIDTSSGSVSARGTFFEANILGSWSAAVTVLAIGLAVFDDEMRQLARIGMVALAVVAGLACLASLTRGAWLGLACGIAIAGWVGFRAFPRGRVARRAIGIALVLLVTIALAGLAPTLIDRGASALTDSTGTIAFRLQRYALAFHDWLQSPIVGLGTNSFGQRHPDPSQDFQPDYLAGLGIATLHDIGVLGTLCLTVVFVICGARLLRALKPQSNARVRAAAVAGLGALASLLVSYQATSAFWFSYNWILLGIFAVFMRTRSQLVSVEPHGGPARLVRSADKSSAPNPSRVAIRAQPD